MLWIESSIVGMKLADTMVRMLGEAMIIMDRSWNSLLENELEHLVKNVEGAQLLNFKVDSLRSIAIKANKLLNYYADKKCYD